MTMIRIGPHTELNVVTINGNPEPDRQTPTWGRARLDHFGLQAASAESFQTIRRRLIEHGASDGNVNDFGAVRSLFFRDPDGLKAKCSSQNRLATSNFHDQPPTARPTTAVHGRPPQIISPISSGDALGRRVVDTPGQHPYIPD